MNDILMDIHSHILPGVDDGSKDIEMSMQMVEEAYAQGVRTMIATPHYYPGHSNCAGTKLKSIYEDTKARISERYPDFTLLLGNEIYYKKDVIALLKEGRIHTMAGTRYVLIEFSVTADFRYLYDAVYQCVNAGFFPIIAHVERYRCLLDKEGKLGELIRAGAYIQVNAENFGKGWFCSSRKRVMSLIRAGLVHFLGSDCHNMQTRRPDLSAAVQYLRKKETDALCKELLEENPQKLLQNKCI